MRVGAVFMGVVPWFARFARVALGIFTPAARSIYPGGARRVAKRAGIALLGSRRCADVVLVGVGALLFGGAFCIFVGKAGSRLNEFVAVLVGAAVFAR